MSFMSVAFNICSMVSLCHFKWVFIGTFTGYMLCTSQVFNLMLNILKCCNLIQYTRFFFISTINKCKQLVVGICSNIGKTINEATFEHQLMWMFLETEMFFGWNGWKYWAIFEIFGGLISTSLCHTVCLLCNHKYTCDGGAGPEMMRWDLNSVGCYRLTFVSLFYFTV